MLWMSWMSEHLAIQSRRTRVSIAMLSSVLCARSEAGAVSRLFAGANRRGPPALICASTRVHSADGGSVPKPVVSAGDKPRFSR
ncbi:exported hypothetical protein [Cupriavidus taiwanensis]|uniref:Uncharacterized protein n=1 Tax=Cupriavidus taiwanensis TaxID=164546 RepID=A0A975WNV5_9BURK|nr:exported hypothetical protein [Cupriavidus taiwanensis]